jgi:hypothetical protein
MSGYHTLTPRLMAKSVERCFRVDRTPFISGPPGVGKSAIVKQIAARHQLAVIDHRLSTSDPTDLSGLPDRGGDKATFKPYDIFPIKGDPLPEGKKGWVLFMDEMNAADRSVQAAAYKLILDRQVGQHDLHENVVIAAAGNRLTDRAIVADLSTAMQSRVIHLELEVSHREWLEDVALKNNYDHRILAFLSDNKGMLHDFKPDHGEKTFCCPRTWEFMQDLIKDMSIPEMDEYVALLAGTITSGVAVNFIQYSKVFEHLPRTADIIKDPDSVRVPNDNPTCYALTLTLTDYVDEKTIENIGKFMDRMGMEHRILFWRTMLAQRSDLREHEVFARSVISLNRYLNGPSTV